MPKTKAIIIFLTIFFGGVFLAHDSLAWTWTADFETGMIGSRAGGSPCSGSPVTCTGHGISNPYSDSTFDNTYAYSGTKSMKTHFIAGSAGSDTTGGEINYPTQLSSGSEIWGRFYLYTPSPPAWQWNSIVKVFRLAHLPGGYISIFNYYGSNSIALSNELDAQVNHERATGYQFDYNKWQCLEMYIKFSKTNGIIRIWKDGILIREENQTRTTDNPPFYHGYQTISSDSDLANYALVWTYWNNGAPQNQDAWVDDIVITTDTPTNRDAYGHPMIGPADWGGSDNQAPTIPSNLSATAISSSQINLSWTASTDNVGVTGYKIYRCQDAGCSPTTQVATSPTNSYSDTGLIANTTYVYKVAAYDAAGNVSEQSSFASATTQGASGQTIFFTESFDDSNFSSRGWFDNSLAIDTNTKQAGAASALFSWSSGSVQPAGNSGPVRRNITSNGTDKLYVSFYWRFNSNWVGSGRSYHPHLINILSDLDDQWAGPSRSYLNNYIEVSATTPRLIIQDAFNIATTPTPPWSTTNGTENRAVGGCNGTLSGSDAGNIIDCYQSSGLWNNGRAWLGSANFSLGSWHKVEVYFQMNSVSGGIGQPDGIMWEKVDGNYVINKTNVIYRTGQHPTMKWKTFMIAPYIGDGSPQAQTMWMDELVVADSPPAGSSDTTPPAPPTGVSVS